MNASAPGARFLTACARERKMVRAPPGVVKGAPQTVAGDGGGGDVANRKSASPNGVPPATARGGDLSKPPTGTGGAAAPPEPTDVEWPPDRPDLLRLLPLVYAAWSDGVLADPELEDIRERVIEGGGLDRDACALLRAWLDPAAPPSPEALANLRDRAEELGAAVTGEGSNSLVALGLQLSRSSGGASSVAEDAPGLAALEELERGLGVVASETARELLGRPAPDAPIAPSPPVLDVPSLRDYLDRPHTELRREVLAALAEEQLRIPPGLDVTEHRRRVRDALHVLAARGWGGLAYPVEHGGANDPAKSVAVFETLAFGDLSVVIKYGVQFGLFGGAILHLGSGRHHARYLPGVARLEVPGCYGMTETGHGSNVRSIETVVRWDADGQTFVVDTPTLGARKDYIGGAAEDARLSVLFAQLEVAGESHGVHAFLVPLRDDQGRVLTGIHIEDCGLKEGLNGVDNGRISFDGVRIPRENLLDRFGRVTAAGTYTSPIPSPGRRFFTMLGTLVAGRISIAAASLSAAKTGLTIAVRYGSKRRQFGPSGGREVTLLTYQFHRRQLLPRLAANYALHFALRDLVDRYDSARSSTAGSRDRRDVEARAAGLKAVASRHCVETLQACREACGGQGYLAANRFAALKADTDVFTTFEGANPVLLQLVAKALLAEYREEMGELTLRGLLRVLTERAGTRLAELNPVTTRRTEEEHLRDPDFQASAFRYREERLLRSVAGRLKARIDDGVDSFHAMNDCQTHLIALARAHVERLAAGAFREAVACAPVPGLSEALRTLSDLYALSRFERERAWFLESGYFEPIKSRAIRRFVDELCAEVAEYAVPLVDAFGIPDAVLDAPVGSSSA